MVGTRHSLIVAFAAAMNACAGPGQGAGARPSLLSITEADVRRLESALADDSLEGRMTATLGSARAAAIIARVMREAGLTPAGDSGYFQRIPVALVPARNGAWFPTVYASLAALDTVPAERRPRTVNVLGVMPGSDPLLRDQYILIDAHYDHLGKVGQVPTMCSAKGADSICNGADDDASGIVAMLESAIALNQGPRPRRSIVFAAMTGEETELLLGTQWYIAHPAVSLARLVGNLEIEMIARPDSLAGGRGGLWLTGYERTTLGEKFAAAGLRVVADPRPDQQFFMRSDNIAFARRGIPAVAISSFNLHADYHTPSDDVAHVDFVHMTMAVNEIAKAIRLMASDDDPPHWKPGGQPPPQ